MCRRVLSAAALLLIIVALTSASDSPPEQRIEIEARRFTYQPNQITVQRHVPVVLVFHSKDVTHGIVISDFGLQGEIHKGETTELRFKPYQAGTYQGRCSHFCGSGHGKMIFTIHVK